MSSAPSSGSGPDDPADRVRRRSVFRVGALIILGASVVPLLTGGDVLITIGAHVLWAGWVALVGELMARNVFSVERAGLASTTGGMIFLPAIIVASGQTGALFYLLLICMPLIVAAMAPGDQPSVLMSGVGGLGWIFGFELWAGHHAGRIIGWACFSLLCSSIAVWATVLHRRSEAVRERAEADRIAALERLAERERREARTERLALLGQLAANIAHEVNNPLAYVTANLAYLRDLLDAPPPATADDRHEVFDETAEGLSRIGSTIRILQLFVRPSGGPPVGHVADAVREALVLTQIRLKKLTVPKTTVGAGLPPVAIGQRRLVQVLVNLILNAVDAIEGTPSPELSISAVGEGGGVRVVVEDSGRNVTPPSPSPEGPPPVQAGLGLALCREHVEEAGGTLTVEARPEGGSRVSVALALAVSPAAP